MDLRMLQTAQDAVAVARELSAIDTIREQVREAERVQTAMQKVNHYIQAKSAFESFTHDALRELDKIQQVQAVLQFDAAERMKREVALTYASAVNTFATSYAQDEALRILRQNENLLQAHKMLAEPAWAQLARWDDAVSRLQQELLSWNHVARDPWYLRDGSDLSWLVAGKSYWATLHDHARLVAGLVTSAPSSKPPPWRPADAKVKLMLTSTLKRVLARWLSALRGRVLALHATLLHNYVFGPRFAAAIKPVRG